MEFQFFNGLAYLRFLVPLPRPQKHATISLPEGKRHMEQRQLSQMHQPPHTGPQSCEQPSKAAEPNASWPQTCDRGLFLNVTDSFVAVCHEALSQRWVTHTTATCQKRHKQGNSGEARRTPTSGSPGKMQQLPPRFVLEFFWFKYERFTVAGKHLLDLAWTPWLHAMRVCGTPQGKPECNKK